MITITIKIDDSKVIPSERAHLADSTYDAAYQAAIEHVAATKPFPWPVVFVGSMTSSEPL